jgi:uncharacterized protein YfaQ (DUF2300 family)
MTVSNKVSGLLGAVWLGLAPGAGQAQTCQPLPQSLAWLLTQRQDWDRRLAGTSGFEPPAKLSVCALRQGHSYAEPEHGRIFLRRISPAEDRLTLAHEYLHLAFRYHPHGSDEHYVEGWARWLLGPSLESTP